MSAEDALKFLPEGLAWVQRKCNELAKEEASEAGLRQLVSGLSKEDREAIEFLEKSLMMLCHEEPGLILIALKLFSYTLARIRVRDPE